MDLFNSFLNNLWLTPVWWVVFMLIWVVIRYNWKLCLRGAEKEKFRPLAFSNFMAFVFLLVAMLPVYRIAALAVFAGLFVVSLAGAFWSVIIGHVRTDAPFIDSVTRMFNRK